MQPPRHRVQGGAPGLDSNLVFQTLLVVREPQCSLVLAVVEEAQTPPDMILQPRAFPALLGVSARGGLSRVEGEDPTLTVHHSGAASPRHSQAKPANVLGGG